MPEHRPATIIGALASTTVAVSPKWRSRLRSNRIICHIDMSALAGVLFVVVFVYQFGILTPGIDLPRGSVDLAKVRHPDLMRGARREDALIVAVQRDGRVFMGSSVITATDLPDMIRQGIRRGAENRVYIKADARSRYRDVETVLDQVRASGVGNIAFLTDQRRPPNQ